MNDQTWLTFPALQGLAHRFVLRQPGLAVGVERAEAMARLHSWHIGHVQALGYSQTQFKTAEQVHGDRVAVVDAQSVELTQGVDGLVTNDPAVLLGIYVADCAAVYLADVRTGALGLVHSGKKGTELGIVPKAIHLMTESFGSDLADIRVQISPCIRPPAYEIDFAAEIGRQCLAAGIRPGHLHDAGVCTSSDLQRFYSYRVEKGRTGRMLALLGRLPG